MMVEKVVTMHNWSFMRVCEGGKLCEIHSAMQKLCRVIR